MKIIVSSIALATLLTSVTITSAQQPYFAADGGGIIQQDSTLRLNLNHVQLANNRVSYDAGYRFDLAAGVDLDPWIAAEINGGYMWDSVDKVGVQTLSSLGEKADFYSFPILGNLIFKIPNPTPLVPYVGVGGGGVVSIFHFKSATDNYSPSDVEPAVQGQAGVNFIIAPNATLGVSYKFLATLDERYSANTTSGPANYRFDDTFIHGFFVNFTLKF